jgi:hypothetical protein
MDFVLGEIHSGQMEAMLEGWKNKTLATWSFSAAGSSI